MSQSNTPIELAEIPLSIDLEPGAESHSTNAQELISDHAPTVPFSTSPPRNDAYATVLTSASEQRDLRSRPTNHDGQARQPGKHLPLHRCRLERIETDESTSTSQFRCHEAHPDDAVAFQSLLTDFAEQILRQQGRYEDQPSLSGFYEGQRGNLFKVKTRQKLPEIDSNRQRLIDEIWSNVKPFHMDQVDVMRRTQNLPTPLHLECQLIDDLEILFKPDGKETLSRYASPHLSILRAKVKQLDFQPSFPWDGFGVMALCVSLAQENGVQLGEILRSCYLHGILEQPKETESKNYLQHILLVIEASLLMDETLHFDAPMRDFKGDWVGGLQWCVEVLTSRKSLDEVFGIDIHSLLEVYHAIYNQPSLLVRATGTTFAIDDLNIKDLRSIGKLQIEWTLTLEEHLLLDLPNRVLFVAWTQKPFSHLGTPMDRWQDMMKQHLPRTFVEYATRQPVDKEWFPPSDEILLSWAILFATSPLASQRNNDVAELGQPPVLELSNPPNKGLPLTARVRGFFWDLAAFSRPKPRHNSYERYAPLAPHQGAVDTRFSRPHVDEGYRAMIDAALNKESVAYNKFPVYESRLRELRYYMDSQKPRGLRQLWSDNRDSLSYYTFWGVILFGGMGILLAFFSLAVSIAQTVASFKALQLASPPAAVPTA